MNREPVDVDTLEPITIEDQDEFLTWLETVISDTEEIES